jgi:hypothetical protein
MQEENFDKMASDWFSPIIARAEVGKFTGGGISPKTMANADSKGIGPKDRFRIGRKVCYPVTSLIDWLRQSSRRA